MIRNEAKLSFHGLQNPKGSSKAIILVNHYVERRCLEALGYKFNGDKVTDFEAKYLSLCHREFSAMESERIKKRK